MTGCQPSYPVVPTTHCQQLAPMPLPDVVVSVVGDDARVVDIADADDTAGAAGGGATAGSLHRFDAISQSTHGSAWTAFLGTSSVSTW